MRALLRTRLVVAVAVIGLATACESPTRPAGRASSPDNPRLVISDATNGGTAGFYFLPPMVAYAGPYAGAFDGGLSPVVRICRWISDACVGSDITFAAGSGNNRIIVQGESYSTVWTETSTFEAGAVYRLKVFESESSANPLGYADLFVVNKLSDFGAARAFGVNSVPDYIPVVKGTPFVIRFRIETERGAPDVAPAAVNDGPAAGSSPGDAYHGAFNTVFQLAAPGLLSNDNLGSPAATIASFGIISNGLSEAASTHAAGATVSLGSGGSLLVNADGSVSLTPPTGFTGYVVFLYRLTNSGGSSDATASIGVGRRATTANDTYAPSLIGNVTINTATSSQFSVLANDPGDGMSAALVSASNGTAVVGSDGKFSFTPDAGFSGTASFTYRATNGFGDAPATATVSLTVGAPVWFVNAGASVNGDGRFGTPFNCLVGAGCFDPAAADAANEVIFLYSGNYTAGLTLLAGQKLIGQGATSSFGASAGVVWPADAGPEPATNGVAPTLTTSAANTSDVTLATGNTLRGLTLGNATAAALSGTNFGTLAISEVAINSTGQALDLSNGTVTGSLSGVTSAGGANNVSLANVATSATFSLGSGALSGATNESFLVSGGNGAVSYAGSITNATTLAARITGKTGGSVTLSGDINPAAAARGLEVTNNGGGATIAFTGGSKKIGTGAATGVALTNNTGATISFSGGGLAIATTTGNGFAATGGGTITVSGNDNTIASVGGIALYAENTTIGAAGLAFRSISADGGSNGIVLRNTGSTGGLSVTGAASASGSGGTIRNMTGADGSASGSGVYLENAHGVSLNYMTLNDHENFAIRGHAVAGFSMDRVRITGANGNSDVAHEASILFTELTGSASIARSVISGGVEDNIRVENTAGTLTSLAFTQDTVQDNSSATGGNGISILARGSASMSVSVSASLFSGNRAKAIRGDASANSSVGMSVAGNTFVAGSPNQGTKGVEILATGDAQVAYDIDGNKVGTDGATNQPLGHTGIDVLGDSRSTMTGKVRNNTVWSVGAGGGIFGIRVLANDTSNVRANISGNTVSNVGGDYGLLVEASGADTQVPPAGTGTVDVGLTGNTVNVLTFALDAMRVQSRHNNRVCARISGNASTSTASGFFGLLVRQVNASSFKIEGLSGSAGTYLAGLNPAVTDGVADNGGTFTSVPANTCNIPQ